MITRSCARCGEVFREDETRCHRGCTADGAKVNVLHGCGGPDDAPNPGAVPWRTQRAILDSIRKGHGDGWRNLRDIPRGR